MSNDSPDTPAAVPGTANAQLQTDRLAGRRLAVANRGEIAVRIFRTARRLGMHTIAVVAPGDERAFHARCADEVVRVPSYLDSTAIVTALTEARAELVHPGYGFLSEQRAFAEEVIDAGIGWVGPSPAALGRGGDKLEAKALAARAGVPTLPTGSPEEVGYPLLVKAAAGGGGRGMRIVRTPDELDEALAAAAREAEAAFGDRTVYCERYLERPRHIEVQVLGDRHGHVLALGARDCSVQRRHQKVVEEAPPPRVEPALVATLARHAVSFAGAIGYSSAGTAEFLVDGDDVFFLELNARIQVEHPVTEAVTGLDLVELQLAVAVGASLAGLDPIEAGHAIEARIYAEDPLGFLPQPGTVEVAAFPQGVRVDAGVESGDEISAAYDPMIAKVIATGADRGEALDRLARALDETSVTGVVTNLPFLRWLVAHPAFRAAEVSTDFLTRYPPLSAPPRGERDTGQSGWRLNLPSVPARPAPQVETHAHAGGVSGAESGAVTSPMPGTVVAIRVAEGDAVQQRQPLLVIEAMKMEHVLTAPFDGVIEQLAVSVGDSIAARMPLVTVRPRVDA